MSRKRALHFLCSCVKLSSIHDLTVYTKKKISRESKKLFISVNRLGSLCPAKESETSAVDTKSHNAQRDITHLSSRSFFAKEPYK